MAMDEYHLANQYIVFIYAIISTDRSIYTRPWGPANGKLCRVYRAIHIVEVCTSSLDVMHHLSNFLRRTFYTYMYAVCW